MGVSHRHHAGIAALLIDRDDVGRRAERKRFAEGRNTSSSTADRAHVVAHHLADGEIAHPADIGGAADGLAAQMEAPGGERIAEHLARHLRRDDHRDQHRRRQPQVAGGFQRDEGHGQRPADDRGRKRAHADHRIGVRIEMTARPDRRQRDREQVPPSAPISSEEKNKPPRNPEPSEMIEATILRTKSSATVQQRQLEHSGKVQRAVARRHHLRRDDRQKPDEKPAHRCAQRWPQLQPKQTKLRTARRRAS